MQPQEFEELYKTHYKMLRRAAAHLTGDADSAHDLVQEVFLKLWNRSNELDAILNPGPYLYRAVVNAAYTYIETTKGKKQPDENTAATPSGGSAGIELKELEERVRIALEKLPPRCRAVFVLSRFEEKKNKEIAELLNLSLKTVENQMTIALRKMKEELQSYLGRDILGLLALLGLSFF